MYIFTYWWTFQSHAICFVFHPSEFSLVVTVQIGSPGAIFMKAETPQFGDLMEIKEKLRWRKAVLFSSYSCFSHF